MPATIAEQRMAELEKKYGISRNVTLGREFALPSGVKETYSPSGDFVSKELPFHYTNVYLPADQKKLERYYKERSDIAMNRELTESERQDAMDKVDAMISRVPRISPMMKEPTTQQKAESQIVTIDDNKYFYDGKALKPLEADKAKVELANEMFKRKQQILNELAKQNQKADGVFVMPRSYDSLIAEADMKTKLEYGQIEKTAKTNAKLDPAWQIYKSAIDNNQNNKGRATEESMFDMMKNYVNFAGNNYGVSAVDAKYDFLQRWKNALDNGDQVVAVMSPQTERRMYSVAASTIAQNDPALLQLQHDLNSGETLRRGEGKVTAGGKTTTIYQGQIQEEQIPAGLENLWPALDDEDKKVIKQKLDEGWTVQEILAAIGKA